MQKANSYLGLNLIDRRDLLFLLVYFGFLILMGVLAYTFGSDKIKQNVLQNSNIPTSYEAPSLTVNISSVSTRVGSLKMEMSLKVASKDTENLKAYMPRIVDRLHSCMARSSVEEVTNNHSFALFRENLLREMNTVSGPVRILDVYVTKLLTS